MFANHDINLVLITVRDPVILGTLGIHGRGEIMGGKRILSSKEPCNRGLVWDI